MGKTVIIGAGLAGLSAGYHAGLKSLDYELFEAEPAVGGYCRTTYRNGFLFDYSGHLLHLKDRYFQSLVRELLVDNMNILTRNAVIYSHRSFTRYPFQANLFGLPAEVVKECLLEFVKAYHGGADLPTREYPTFHDWIVAKLGSGIGRHFMFPYNEKLWTVPTGEMTCEWMSEYVPKPDLEDVFKGAFEDQSRGFGYNATFWYPKHGGIQALCNALAARVKNIRLNRRAVSIDLKGRTVAFDDGEKVPFDRLVSTIPLNRLASLFGEQLPDVVRSAFEKLRHNSVLIINLGVKGSGITDRHWIYLPERRFTAYRTGVYSNFSEALVPGDYSSYYIEIGYQKAWSVDKDTLVEKAVNEMVELGLLRNPDDIKVRDVTDLECAYVIYDANHRESRKTIMEWLNSQGIYSIGRYGNWEYSGMEEAMMQGKIVLDLL